MSNAIIEQQIIESKIESQLNHNQIIRTKHKDLFDLRDKGFQIVTGHHDKKYPNILWEKYQHNFIEDDEFISILNEHDDKLYCLITGKISNTVVIDIDSASLYNKYFKKYQDKTIVVQTPSGGFHLWFQTNTIPKNSTGYNGLPIDIRGKGGQVVIPPSISNKGKYTFINKNNLIPMSITSIDDILKDLPTNRQEGTLKDQLKLFYKKLAKNEFDILKIAQILKVKDLEQIEHKNYKSQCIFTKHKTPNQEMEIYIDTNTIFCHGCGESGDLIDLVMKVKDIKMSEAIIWLEKITEIKSNIDFSILIINNTFIQNFCNVNDKGHLIFHRMEIAEYLIKKFNALISKDKYMYIYDNGIYKLDYGTTFETELNEMFGDYIDIRETNEIMRKIYHYPGNKFDELETLWINEDFICLKNGVFDIKEHKLIPHDPKYYFLSRLPTNYIEDAKCPMLNNLMKNVFTDTQIEDEYEWLGYSLLGGNKHKLISFYLGNTDSGKSTYFNVITELFGIKNISTIEPQDLTKEFYSIGLLGKMLNIVGDVGTHKIIGFHKMKQYSGNDTIMANVKGKPMVSFINNAKMMFGANRMPSIDDNTTAGFNRIRQINLERTIPENNKETFNLKDYITDIELSGFLNLIINGLYRLQARGKFNLKSLEERTEDFENATNSIYHWESNCIEFTNIADDKIYLKDLFDSYHIWYKASGMVIPLSLRAFATDFRNAFNKKYLKSKVIKIDGKTGRGFTGIIIHKMETDDENENGFEINELKGF